MRTGFRHLNERPAINSSQYTVNEFNGDIKIITIFQHNVVVSIAYFNYLRD